MPTIASHILFAQTILGKPSVLSRAVDPEIQRANRAIACAFFVAPSPALSSCDEYPFASTYEGGEGASIQGVPPREQNVQGGVVSSFYRTHLGSF